MAAISCARVERRRGVGALMSGWWVAVMMISACVVGGGAREGWGQCPMFASPVTYAGGVDVGSVLAADVNGDGKVDLIVVGNGVRILPGTGAGTFGTATNLTTGSNNPHAAAVGDFNGDGKMDLAVTNLNTDNVSIFLGAANGVFGTPTSYATGGGPFGIAMGDFNGDGKLDLAVACTSSTSVSVLLGTGMGTFAPATSVSIGGFSLAIAVGDLNGDGKLDLVVGNYQGVRLFALFGTGSGAFGSPNPIPVGRDPNAIALADVNGDGILDIVAANVTGGNVNVVLGRGAGLFGDTAYYYTAGQTPQSVVLGDFNGDGRIDIAVGRAGGVTILAGTALGSFVPLTAISTIAGGIAAGDFNRDGRADLAIAGGSVAVLLALDSSAGVAITLQPLPQSVVVGGTATFAVSASVPTGSSVPGYQWRRNGVNLSSSTLPSGASVQGAISATLILEHLALADSGAAFDCIVSNGCGSVRSDPAGLRVTRRCVADVNESGFVDVRDVFDFLNAWLAGCP